MKLPLQIFPYLSVLLLLMVAASVSSQDDEEPDYDCTFSEEISIHPSGQVLLQHYVNYFEGTFTMRVRYTGGHSYIGIGTNYIGRPWMAPAYAVIGDKSREVKRYWLEEEYEDGSGNIPYPDVNGHLKASSFVQNDDTDETLLEFTHDLIIRDEETGTNRIEYEHTADSTWIWAVGLPDNQWEGVHRLHGSFQINLFDSCVPKTSSPTAAPISTNTDEDPDEEEEDGELDELEEQESKNEEKEQLIASGGPRETPPSEAEQVTDEGTSETPTTSTTVVSASQSSSISFIESESANTRSLWVAHGNLMGLAWGGLAPLAIGASLLRHRLGKHWLLIHLSLNGLIVVLTFVGFVLALEATDKDGGDHDGHFAKDKHHKIGLAIFILVLVQFLAGYIRPGLGGNKQPSSNTSAASSTTKEIETPKDEEETKKENDIDQQEPINDMDKNSDKDSDTVMDPPPEAAATAASSNNTSSKSVLRHVWEYSHRCLGMVLIALAWYNCHSGIVLQAQKYYQDDEQQLLAIFWGITGGIAGLVFFLAYVIRL
jgi:hypothetical protein